jgi:DNA polymerase
MNTKHQLLLQEMGYTLWQRRPPENTAQDMPQDMPEPVSRPVARCVEIPLSAPQATNVAAASPADDRAARIARMEWEELAQAAQDCRACELCKRRRQAVLGVGDRQADWLFVGEGPGAEEDARGEPFVGQAGKLLDAMLAAIGLARGERVYIANAVKCRPEGNRTPHAEEMAICRPFLMRQVELLQPRIMLLLGKAAVHSVLGEDRSLASMRQKRFQHDGIPVLVTYHPAYLLRNLPEKAKAWEDLCLARRVFSQDA